VEFEKYDKRLAKLGVEKPIAVEAYIMEVSAGERVHKEQDKESQKKSAVGMLELEKFSKLAVHTEMPHAVEVLAMEKFAVKKRRQDQAKTSSDRTSNRGRQ
jgi:hypothetical protein